MRTVGVEIDRVAKNLSNGRPAARLGPYHRKATCWAYSASTHIQLSLRRSVWVDPSAKQLPLLVPRAPCYGKRRFLAARSRCSHHPVSTISKPETNMDTARVCDERYFKGTDIGKHPGKLVAAEHIEQGLTLGSNKSRHPNNNDHSTGRTGLGALRVSKALDGVSADHSTIRACQTIPKGTPWYN